MPAPSEPSTSTCSNCGAALVADQRYCLSCGQPCSPVRLAFLDALQPEQTRATPPQPWQSPFEVYSAGYMHPLTPAEGWLRRYSGVLSLLSVLALCLLAGLLVGHWASQGGGTPSRQVIEVKGLAAGAVGSGAAAQTTPQAESTETSSGGKPSATTEKKEAEEGAHETAAEKAPPPKPKTVTKAKLNKLTNSSGKKHQEEINALGDQPIETG